jgi:hypothetical protein
VIVYLGNKKSFISDAYDGIIGSRLHDLFHDLGLRQESKGELRSWENSLTQIAWVLQTSEKVDDEVQIALEYQVPPTAKRIDFMLGGSDGQKQKLIIVELKQWEKCELTDKENLVRTYVGGGNREVVHPSYQAYTYADLLRNYNEAVYRNHIELLPCVYLHNFSKKDQALICDERYQQFIDKAPIFFKESRKSLSDFFSSNITKPTVPSIFKVIENGKIKPSKALQTAIGSILNGNKEFEMIDEQQVAYATVLKLIQESLKDGKKHTIIIQGGPGTGKSVIAINLLAKIIRSGSSCAYVTKTSAPRCTFSQSLVKGDYTIGYLKGLFKSSGTFIDEKPNAYDCLVVDEAHRLVRKSGMYGNLGENQVKEIISACRVSVFFVDEGQIVTMKDIGTIDEIEKQARELGSEIHSGDEFKLTAQFRCNGSDGYIAFLDDVLGIRETANANGFDIDYDLRIFDDASAMREALREKNGGNKARMIAGYCYPWASKEDKTKIDISLPGGFEAQWNFTTDKFATDPQSFDQVGCIHSTQGLEFDYVGVIIGQDLRYEEGKVITDCMKRYRKTDKSIGKVETDQDRKKADTIIRNTYKVLLSRGQKGCFVYCEDEALRNYLRERLQRIEEIREFYRPENVVSPSLQLSLFADA